PKTPMRIEDTREHDSPLAKRFVEIGVRSVLGIPIMQNDRCVAHIILNHREPEIFTDEHEKLLVGIAGHLGSAIRNAILFQEVEEKASRLEIVDKIAKAIGSTLEPKELFRTIVREIRDVVPCERCSIATVDPATLKRRYWHIESNFDIPAPTDEDEFEGGKRLLELIYEPKTSLLSTDPADMPWPHLKDNGVQSSLVIPILMDNKCVAHITLSNQKTEAFTRAQQGLLQDVAAHLGSAILNATLYQTSEDRASRLETLQDMTRKLNEDIDLSDRLARIAEGGKILLGASKCMVLVQQDNSANNKPLYSQGLSQNYLDLITNNFDKTLLPEVHKIREPVTISDISHDPRYPFPIELAAKEGIASVLIVPLIYKENIIGTISFYWEKTVTLTDAEVAMGKAFADQAAVAIEIARLFRETEEHGRRLGTLVEVAQRLTRGLDLTDVLSSITDATALVLGGEAGIRLREGNELVRAAGTPRALRQMTKLRILIGEGLAGRAAETGKPTFASDISTDERTIKEEVAHSNLGLTGSQISVPLSLESRNLGVFNIYRELGHVFTEEERNLATSLADQAAVAIENARLYQEAEKRGKRLETLVEVAQRLTRGLDIPDVLNAITEAAADVFEGESAIRIREGDELLWTTGTRKAYSLPFKKRLHIGESLAGQVALTGKPIRVKDFLDDDRVIPEHRNMQMPEELSSMMLIPLRLETRVVGVLAIFRERGYIFDDESLRIGSTFADQAAIAIENARLFEQVKERTEEMEKAKNQAETVNNAKSEFLSNMSHELRSPLNAVLGFSDLLLLMVKDEKLLDIASKIKDSGKHITRLIDDLLDLDRIGSGKVSLDLEDVTINSLLKEISEIRSDQLPKEFSLKSNFDAQCGNVKCDPLRITQIMTNLLDNAVKYSPEGGTITLKTEAVSGEVIITVEDEGLGMTPDEISVIFERFSQLESGINTRAGGLGLGLGIVKKLLEMHGGRILVKSTKGVGSTFSLILPMTAANEKTATRKKRKPESAALSGDPWAGKKILIVDDTEENHEYVKLLMKSASDIFSAYNGQEGIEAARREKPDIIFMDLRMPVLNGFEAIEKLKIEADTKGIPVLAVTAQAMKKDRDRCMQLGVSGFITKPIEIEAFKTAVHEILN
ncbi:MAG: GAF domain-containing protein, partial [Nitrospinaceae bacterium]|nr:GAF domain-containing protein [Nitrospinaceae bacterium]